MTEKLSSNKERISLEDIALAQQALDFFQGKAGRRTYEFYITSDTLPDREETQS